MKIIIDTILDLEKKHHLLEWKIADIYAWQSARAKIYQLLLNTIIPNNSGHKKKNLIKKYLNFSKRIFMNSLFYNPFISFDKYDTLVFESDRRYFVEGKYIDIYTKYFCDELEKENILYKKIKPKHQDFIHIISLFISNFIKPKICKYDFEKINNLECEINDLLGVKIDISAIFIQEIKRFKSSYPFYSLLLKIKNIKNVYLINSTDKASLIKAAKDLNIIVNELQHGLIVKEGLIANYPNTVEDSLAYFPNKFFIWEKLNMVTSKLPLSDKNIINFKNKHLQNMLEKNKDIAKKDNQILVISQPYGSSEILKYILENSKEMQKWNFIYKMHPVENHDSFRDAIINDFSKYSNITFVNNNQSVYSLMSESSYVVGIFSTALFEASYFGCKIILLNLPGVEFSFSLIKNSNAILLDTEEKLSHVLK